MKKQMALVALVALASCAAFRSDLSPRQKAWAAIVDARETLNSTTRFMTTLAKAKKLKLADAERFELARKAAKDAIDVADAAWTSGDTDALTIALDVVNSAITSLINSKLAALGAPPDK